MEFNQEYWQEMMNNCTAHEKRVLHLYRIFIVYPWRVFFFFVAIFSILSSQVCGGLPDAEGLVILSGVAPLVAFFFYKYFLSSYLRMRGIPADYLRGR